MGENKKYFIVVGPKIFCRETREEAEKTQGIFVPIYPNLDIKIYEATLLAED